MKLLRKDPAKQSDSRLIRSCCSNLCRRRAGGGGEGGEHGGARRGEKGRRVVVFDKLLIISAAGGARGISSLFRNKKDSRIFELKQPQLSRCKTQGGFLLGLSCEWCHR